jgi:hypothetical protein
LIGGRRKCLNQSRSLFERITWLPASQLGGQDVGNALLRGVLR